MEHRRRRSCSAQAAKFGFGDSLTIPMRVTPSTVPADLNAPQLAQSAIGQYDVQVDAAADGDGRRRRRQPRHGDDALPRGVGASAPTSTVIESTPTRRSSRRRSRPEVAAQLTRMMEAVVEDGTGRRAQIPGVEVAGKTGTAQHGEGRKAHAWFISFAPADDPEIAVAVIAEDGGVAGSEAGGGRLPHRSPSR